LNYWRKKKVVCSYGIFFLGTILVITLALLHLGCSAVYIPYTLEEEYEFAIGSEDIQKLTGELARYSELGLYIQEGIPNHWPDDIPEVKVDHFLERMGSKDFTGNNQISKYADRIEDVYIDSFSYQIESNSLTHDISSIQYFLGDKSGYQPSLIGKFPPLPGAVTGKGVAEFIPGGKSELVAALLKYRFNYLLRVLIKYSTHKPPAIPAGKIKLKIVLQMTFVTDKIFNLI